MLANSDHRQELTKHCVGAMMLAMHCAKHLGISDDDLINVIGLSAFLHDIGKCTVYFNNISLASDYSEENKQKHYPKYSGQHEYPRHNEISWVYATFHAKAKGRGVRFKDIGPQAIYWHHGTLLNSYEILDQTSPRNTHTVIGELKLFDENEWTKISETIDGILKSVQFPFDVTKYLEDDVDDEPRNIPRLFTDDGDESSLTNAHRMIARSCVIFSDHIVSKLSIEELDDLIENSADSYFPKGRDIRYENFQCPITYDQERFQIQKDIVNSCERTTLVKGSAGFGKSLVGLMWGAQKSGPVYWVCPRNAVAEGVYLNLLKEIDILGLGTISIELYHAGERKATNSPSVPDCGCDIVVTNIDNLLSPMVDSKSIARLFDVTARNVVLDEFHEFLNDEALFGAFVIYMRARNLVCANSHTLLLSATPSIMHKFWEGEGESRRTKILPNPTEHYLAQHKKLYKISFDEDFVEHPIGGSLTMYSSIRNVQGCYGNGYTSIVHSNYGEPDRHAIMNGILKSFGKGGDKNGTVVSAPILQAALDISFRGLFKTIESPESDIQTFGRINRWGEQDGVCELVMLKLRSNKGERSAISERYSCHLSDLWSRMLEGEASEPVDLDFLYRLYNKFNKVYNDELVAFIKNKYLISIDKLKTFFPRARKHQSGKSKVVTAKTLRNSSSSCFIVVKNRTTGVWCPFTFNVQDIELKDLIADNRRRIESSTLKTVWESLEATGEFDYAELTKMFFGKKKPKRLTVENLKPFARCGETPLPIFTWYYDATLGLVKARV
jgi:CRISPR-associated endonuclease Cas3-HD